jgi:hypothetical protein
MLKIRGRKISAQFQRNNYKNQPEQVGDDGGVFTRGQTVTTHKPKVSIVQILKLESQLTGPEWFLNRTHYSTWLDFPSQSRRSNRLE